MHRKELLLVLRQTGQGVPDNFLRCFQSLGESRLFFCLLIDLLVQRFYRLATLDAAKSGTQMRDHRRSILFGQCQIVFFLKIPDHILHLLVIFI